MVNMHVQKLREIGECQNCSGNVQLYQLEIEFTNLAKDQLMNMDSTLVANMCVTCMSLHLGMLTGGSSKVSTDWLRTIGHQVAKEEREQSEVNLFHEEDDGEDKT